MTLEELRLRVMAAFPDHVVLEDTWSLGGGNVCFVVNDDLAAIWCCCPECVARGKQWSLDDDVAYAILSVTAHDLIAARRRLLADAH